LLKLIIGGASRHFSHQTKEIVISSQCFSSPFESLNWKRVRFSALNQLSISADHVQTFFTLYFHQHLYFLRVISFDNSSGRQWKYQER